MQKAGFIAVVGKPNAGKSTLLNRAVGQKLSIVSPKPQSTRDRVVGIRTDGDAQLVFVDTPGLLNPRYPLQEAMRGAALAALADADVILYLVDGSDGPPDSLEVAAALPQRASAPVVLAINKSDLLDPPAREALRAREPEARLISAMTGEGIDDLLQALAAHLPECPFLYPDDEISTQPMRFFTGELIRESALEQLTDEVPYSVACEIEEFRESQVPVYIRAVLHVERESQKGILVGAGGRRIRAIGRAARLKVEALIGSSVYLDLQVKVLPNWRRNPAALRRLGFSLPRTDRP